MTAGGVAQAAAKHKPMLPLLRLLRLLLLLHQYLCRCLDQHVLQPPAVWPGPKRD